GAWHQGPRPGAGFGWLRFCLAWCVFVFCFFSLSGSKLPSYILPLFPAAALTIGWQLERLEQATLYKGTIAAAAMAAIALIVVLFAYDAIAARIADARTPLSIYRQLQPWLVAALAVGRLACIAAVFGFARNTEAGRSAGVAIVRVT